MYSNTTVTHVYTISFSFSGEDRSCSVYHVQFNVFSCHVPVFIFSTSSFFLHVHHLFQSLSMYTSYTSSVKVHECFLVLSDSRNQMICNKRYFEGYFERSVRFREFNLVIFVCAFPLNPIYLV